jgi:hypothetical protein
MSEPQRRTRAASLPSWQRWLVYGTGALLWASGSAWLISHYLLSGQSAFGADEHPLSHWSLVAHGTSAYAAVLAVGSLLPAHMRSAWRLRRNRVTGGAMAALLSLLALSGLWLYYGSAPGREWVSNAHWLLGLLSALWLWLHRRVGLSRTPSISQRSD